LYGRIQGRFCWTASPFPGSSPEDRWQGWWGTPAAFRQSYVGGEPVPGPLARITPTPVIAAAPPPPAAPKTASAAIQPAYAQASLPVAPRPAADTLPGDSQILDRWKDSGKPLR